MKVYRTLPLLKYALFSLSITLCCLLFFSLNFHQKSFSRVSTLYGNEIKNLHCQGKTEKGFSFVLTLQKLKETKKGNFLLESPQLLVNLEAGRVIRIKGNKGFYNSKEEKLILKDNIEISHPDGLFHTQDAIFNLKEGKAYNTSLVEGNQNGILFKSIGFQIHDSGKRIFFPNQFNARKEKIRKRHA